MWILDFLLEKHQTVRVNDCLSDTVCISTGTPQGCVLSPLLFILYTSDCRTCRENRFFVKFSNNTVIVSLLLCDQDDHGPIVSDFVNWCDESYP